MAESQIMDQNPDFVPDEQFKEDAAPASADFVPDDKFVPDEEKTKPDDSVATGIAGMARGATFGLSDALASGMRKGASAIGVPNKYLDYVAPSGEALHQAKEEHPILSGATEFAGSIGGLNSLPKIGSTAIDGLMKMGLVGAGDELSKSMMGHGDNALPALGHIAASGALGLLFGAGAGKAEDWLADKATKMAEEKYGSKILSNLAGIGHRASGAPAALSEEEALQQMTNQGINGIPKEFQKGQDIYDKVLLPRASKALQYGIAGAVAEKAAHLGVPPTLGFGLGLYAGNKIGDYIVPKAAEKIAAPIILKMANSGSMDGLAKAIDYGATASKGYQAIDKGVNSIFQSGAGNALNYLSEMNEKRREKLKGFVEDNGPDKLIEQQQNRPHETAYADGGEVLPPVSNNPIEKHWPEQNALLSASKMRITSYLNSKRPTKNQSKLPYDNEVKDPQHEREYNKTLDLANNPLSVLNHIKDGSLTTKQVNDFGSMYPELHEHLKKKITERITKGQVKEEKKPSYHTRQALSLFMGNNLDSTLSQPNIMAAQMVFAQQRQQRQAAKENSLNKLAQSSQTAEQSREQRLNKS